MIIDCVSDLHGHYPKLDGGDLLILAGDYTPAGKLMEWGLFFKWLKEQPYEKKVIIAGNHDNLFETGFPKTQKEADQLGEVINFLDFEEDFEYLCDSGTEYEGLKIWGSPWTLTFPGINPHCTSFTGSEKELAEKWALIPDNIDILITHGPPYGVFDKVKGASKGSKALRRILNRVHPKLWVFGHIHEGYGSVEQESLTGYEYKFVNASHVNEFYKPVNLPIRIILDPKKTC